MAKKNGYWGILAASLVFGTVLISCTTAPKEEKDTWSNVTDSDEDLSGEEDLSGKEHWWDSRQDGSTVVLDRSIDAKGLNTVIASGPPNPEGQEWYSQVGYTYKAETNGRYKYTFKIWTDSGTAWIPVVARPKGPDRDKDATWLWVETTTEEQTFSLVTKTPLNSGEEESLLFSLGRVTGTFYMQVISIEKTDEPASE
ncbi:MAG: hypothetical protein LBH51_06745 [Treponema sp.]|jgi:hypothetical protein|nr:hypothetical protein [Treponema sp.]